MNFKISLVGLLLGIALGYVYQANNARDKPSNLPQQPAEQKLQGIVETEDSAHIVKSVETPIEDKLRPDDFNLNTLEGLLSYLKKQQERNTPYSFFSDRKLRALLSEQPEIIEGLFSKLMSIEDDELLDKAIRFISLNSLFAKNDQLPEILLEKLQAGREIDAWLSIGFQIGLSSEPLTKFLVDLLLTTKSPSTTSKSLNLLVRSLDNSSDIIDPSIRSNVIDAIAPFQNHSDSKVRVSVVNSYGKFPPPDIEIRLLAAMQDTSANVRSMAMREASQSLNSSTVLKTFMLGVLADSNSHILERQSAALALETMPIDASQFNTIKRTIEEVDAHVRSLSASEQEAFFLGYIENNE